MKNYVTPQFQTLCEKALGETLASSGFSLSNRAIKGQEEKYVYAQISRTNLEIYIYIDGAQISGPRVDLRFEWPDYDTEQEMIESFVSKAVIAAKESAAS